MSKPIFSDSSEASSFCRPHFNLPHPGHVVGFFVFLFHKSYCSDVGLAHLPTNFKIKRHCTSFAYRAPWGYFSPPFCFSFFSPPPPVFLFCFCCVWGGGWEIGVFKSSKHTWARKRSTVRRGTSSSHSHHLQLYGRDSCIGVWKTQDACWVAGSEPSCLNLLRSKAALTWDPVGLPLPRPQREEQNVTGLPSKVHWEAIDGSVVASPGEVWVVVFGKTFGLMDLDSKLGEPTISDAITFGHAFADSP